MEYELEQLTMSDGNTNFFHKWVPENVKMCVILSHGMVEHSKRYERLAELLCSQGIAFFAEDHRGHGETGLHAEKKGTGKLAWLAENDGFNRIVEDIHEEILLVKMRYPGKKVVLLGHSFGSFVSQGVIEKYGNELDGCILSGTAGPRGILIALAKFIGGISKSVIGSQNISSLMNSLSFGPYNARIKNPRTKNDWLSRDKNEVDKYIADPLCGMDATSGFLFDVYMGLSQVHRKSNLKKIPAGLKILFITGTGDPVGDYGKTVKKLAGIYRRNGIRDVQEKFYSEARHELFNETNRDEVEKDVISWLNSL